MMKKQLHRHIRKVHFWGFLAALFAIAAVICTIGSMCYMDQCYEKWLNFEGESSKEKIQSIERAIALRPQKVEAYNKVLDVYLEDELLTASEEEAFHTLLTKHQKDLHKVPGETAALYRRLAFACISRYDASAEDRLKKAHSYFTLAQPYGDTPAQEVNAIETYLQLATYYSEYVWIPGSLRQPSASEVITLINRLSATLNDFQKADPEDALAYACCLASLLDTHGKLWTEKTEGYLVPQLAEKIKMQEAISALTPAAQRLQKELSYWAQQGHYWEESL